MQIVQDLGCTLICSASVRGDRKSTKEDVKLSRQMASVRIHRETIIRRLRDFRFLDPQTLIVNHILRHLDCIVCIPVGIIKNLQNSIILQM